MTGFIIDMLQPDWHLAAYETIRDEVASSKIPLFAKVGKSHDL